MTFRDGRSAFAASLVLESVWAILYLGLLIVLFLPWGMAMDMIGPLYGAIGVAGTLVSGFLVLRSSDFVPLSYVLLPYLYAGCNLMRDPPFGALALAALSLLIVVRIETKEREIKACGLQPKPEDEAN